MKYKTWFRLVVRAIGLLLIGLSLPTACSLAVQLVQSMAWSASTSPGSGLLVMYGGLLGQIVGYGLEFGLGLYLFFGGAWVVNHCIPSNRPYCPECGYDTSSLVSGQRCPECGDTLPGPPPGVGEPQVDTGRRGEA